jgi:hypothetical protein
MKTPRTRPPTLTLLCLLAGMLSPSAGAAQSHGLGFDFKLGYSEMGGDWGAVLQDGVDGEFNILYGLERVRLGFGFNWVSYGLVTTVGEVDSGSQVGLHWAVAYPFRQVGWIRPYVEGRLTWDRFRAENHVDGFPDPEEEDGNNAPKYAGWGGTGVVGVFIPMWGSVLGDISARYGLIQTSEADLEYLGLPVVSSGNRWGVRVGFVWYP